MITEIRKLLENRDEVAFTGTCVSRDSTTTNHIAGSELFISHSFVHGRLFLRSSSALEETKLQK